MNVETSSSVAVIRIKQQAKYVGPDRDEFGMYEIMLDTYEVLSLTSIVQSLAVGSLLVLR